MAKSVFNPPYGLFLDLLRQTRLEAGVSQTELARRLNRPQPFISYIESGERRVDVIEFYAIMLALGADPEASFSKLVRKLPSKVEI